MKVAVLSDIHDHIDNLNKVLQAIGNEVESVIFCGDMVSPFTTKILSSTNLPTYICLGNNDEDQVGMVKRGGDKFIWTHLSEEYGETEIEGRKIAYCHYPKLAELLAREGKYDAVFYGHTHISRNELIDHTLLVNPGAVCAISFEKASYDEISYAIYDTKTNSADIIQIK
jgi:putative phosphoesterase